jgi:hypothetical protein
MPRGALNCPVCRATFHPVGRQAHCDGVIAAADLDTTS